MAKDGKQSWICGNCGDTQTKWIGKCPTCAEWNTFEAAATPPVQFGKRGAAPTKATIVKIGDAKAIKYDRLTTGISELDRVLGGGFVPGSVLLVSGDPGIGKSTLFLQAVTALTQKGINCLYVSGEESEHQIQSRAERLGIGQSGLSLTAEKNASTITDIILGGEFKVVIVDSIQTVFQPELDGIPGSISQVKACSTQLIAAAKQANVVLILIGHVTKSETFSGPNVLAHLTDANFTISAESMQRYRLLRGPKNRYGSTDEVGVFEMTDLGLKEVTNPSGIFIADRLAGLPGSVVFAGMEGSRPILLEIQALVTPNGHGNPRRSSIGFDAARLSMILAVIEARLGIKVSESDVFLNVAGGYRTTEPAADMAVACAILSAMTDTCLDEEVVIMGEIGLGGEVRPVTHLDLRLKEASKLGFPSAFTPKAGDKIPSKGSIHIRTLKDLMPLFGDIRSKKRDKAA